MIFCRREAKLAQRSPPSQGGQSQDGASNPADLLNLKVKAMSPPSLQATQTYARAHTHTHSKPIPLPQRAKYCPGLPEIPIPTRVVLQAAKSRAMSLVKGESYSGFVSGVGRASQKGPVCPSPPPHAGSFTATADNSWQPAPLAPSRRG